jgi:tryptophanyl-tRNA synthetase
LYIDPSFNNHSELKQMRILSGIQPTGRFHWGNFFGAIRQYISFQSDHEGFYFIADLHALTTVRDPQLLQQYVQDAAIDLLALGLDPQKATLFIQSHIPEVSELCWLLMTGTPMSMLENCHAYKDKKSRGIPADAGLFTYPVLMAADILAYDSELVPVGQDQVQHIEVARDLAGSWNHTFGETLKLPKAHVVMDAAKVPGTDGQKMSKSYGNTLPIFGDEKGIRKQIMRIQTDSRPLEDPKDPETDHLFQLFQLFGSADAVQEVAAIYHKGGFGYGDIKKRLADSSEAFFQNARQRRRELEQDRAYVQSVLQAGAERAREVAASVLCRTKKSCGLG